jgi:hypothetical protein
MHVKVVAHDADYFDVLMNVVDLIICFAALYS